MDRNFLLFFIFFPFFANSQVIPFTQIADWGHAGYEGMIPQPLTIADVTTFGAIPNDLLDDYPAILSAISSLNGTAGVVFFPAGTYEVHSSVYLPDSVILRGSGSDSTFLVFDLNNAVANCFNITKGQAATFIPVQSGYLKNSEKLVIANAGTLFFPGDHIEFRETNGSWDTNPASWAGYSVGHISEVDSAATDTLWLHEALRIDFDSTLTPEIRKIIPRVNCGLECFQFTRRDSTASSIDYGVYFYYAHNCWMRGIDSFKSIGAHVWAEASSHLEISGSYFHESYIYDGNNTKGYGVIMSVHTSSTLIVNNIFRKLRHAMMVKQGANGNVYAYNYSIEPTRTEFPPNGSGDLSVHGHYPFANLFEGNIGQNLMIDQAWGPGGPFNTFFRNRLELYGITMSSGSVQSDMQNFAGNDVPSTAPFTGFYILTGSGHFEYGNNIQGVITPSGTGSLTDSSYFFDSIPSFWNITQLFPSVGIPNVPSAENIPARQRFLNGGPLTLCGYQVDTASNSGIPVIPTQGFFLHKYFFSNDLLNLQIYSSNAQQLKISICDIEGRSVLYSEIYINSDISVLRINTHVLPGIYLMQIEGSNYKISSKIIKIN